MRRFILADKTAMTTYPTAIPLTAGQVAFAAFKDKDAGTSNTGLDIDSDGTKIKKKELFFITMGRRCGIFLFIRITLVM